jgi:hypothetical protein
MAAGFSLTRFFISEALDTVGGGCPLPVNMIFDQ